MEGVIGEKCKIRKRRCSSSSSSSLFQNYRMKRAILAGKRGGPSTPVPIWKMGTKSPSMQTDKLMKYVAVKEKDLSMSARKLAATLWEINEVHSPRMRDKMEDKRGQDRLLKSAKHASVVLHLSNPSHSPVSESINQHQRRTSVGSHKLLLTENNLQGLESIHNDSLLKAETQPRDQTRSSHTTGIKTCLKDISNGLTSSKELLKVLSRILGLKEQHSTTISLITALKFELDSALIEIQKLIQEKWSNRNEIDYLLKHFAEEKEVWKFKARDRINKAVKSIAGELEAEKKLRKQTERLNKKLGRELANKKAAHSKAMKELESEKRAREIMEQVCDELAKGMQEDRVEVEEIKRESEKAREEVEKERKMLQLADILREERVQMKLSEAKYEFEEKNTALDVLRNEFEVCLQGNRKGDGCSANYDKIKELEAYLNKTLGQRKEKEEDKGGVVNGEDREEDSGESDLQSIELNMDNNSKSYEWGYACGVAAQNDKIMGRRKSISEKNQEKPVCLERKFSDGIEWEFGTKQKEGSDGFDGGGFYKFASQARREDYEDEIERYRMIKDLRDHIVSGSGLAVLQGAV